MADELESDLLAVVLAAHLPEREPIMQWWRWAESGPTKRLPRDEQLRLRVGDHALLPGRCEYSVRPDGCVDVRDETDPRSTRFQRYDPRRPGQPYLAPSVEDR